MERIANISLMTELTPPRILNNIRGGVNSSCKLTSLSFRKLCAH